MDTFIYTIFALFLFALVIYLAWWICAKFNMPPIVFWFIGGLLLLILLLGITRIVPLPDFRR